MESEFGGEIRDRFLQGRAGAVFSIGVLAGEIFLEGVVNLFQFAQKSFVLASSSSRAWRESWSMRTGL